MHVAVGSGVEAACTAEAAHTAGVAHTVWVVVEQTGAAAEQTAVELDDHSNNMAEKVAQLGPMSIVDDSLADQGSKAEQLDLTWVEVRVQLVLAELLVGFCSAQQSPGVL